MSVKKLRKYKNPLTPKQRSENARKAAFAMLASLTSEQKALRNERIRKIQSKLTPEQRIENGRKANASLTPDQKEQQRERGRKAMLAIQAALTPEQRSERGRNGYKRGLGKLTPDRRREIMGAYRASLTADQIRQMSQQARKAISEYLKSLTQEQRREYGKKGYKRGLGKLTPEQRRERGRKLANSNQALTPERRREIARRAGLASIAAMTPEQRMARGEQLNALFTHEQRSENGRKGREAAEVKINGLENILITIFQELGIYAELETEAQAGQVYYADSKENRRYFYKDGIALIPDFKAKGLPIVFEVHGSGFHTRKKVEYWARIQKEPVREWKWNVTLLKAMYAERGLVCYVYWDYELREPVRREEIKQEVCAVVAKARAHLRK